MARAKTGTRQGRTVGGSTRRKSSPRAAKRAPSTAAQMRKLSREYERETQKEADSKSKADQLREQMLSMQASCPHERLEMNKDTGQITCRDCFQVVGVTPEQMRQYSDEEGEDI